MAFELGVILARRDSRDSCIYISLSNVCTGVLESWGIMCQVCLSAEYEGRRIGRKFFDFPSFLVPLPLWLL